MRIVFDPKLRRPGCVLLQAALGGTVPGHQFHSLFPSETWLVAHTPNMGCYEVSSKQLKTLSRMAHASVRKAR